MLFNLPVYQTVAILGSLLIILLLVELVKRKRLRENYSLLWFGMAFVFLAFSVWRTLLVYLAALLGIDYAPAAILLILVVGLYLLAIHFSIVLSEFKEKNKDITQEMGLLKHEMQKLKEWMKDNKHT